MLEQDVEFYYQGESMLPQEPGVFLDIQIIFLPLSSVELIFSYDDTSVRLRHENNSNQSSGKVVGQHNVHCVCRADNITKVNKSLHVRFKPGGFHRLFGISQVELKNSCFAVGDVLGKEGRLLEDEINNTDSFKARIRGIEAFLLRRKMLARSSRVDRHVTSAIKLIQNQQRGIKVCNISRYLGIPERTLEWEFSNSIGLSPKEFIRVARFRRVLDNMTSGGAFNWSEQTRALEYYDQSHFIKEFKTATTFSPRVFREQFGEKIVKSVNFLVIQESTDHSQHYRQLFSDYDQLERENAKSIRPFAG